jgi:hypothetical protein
MTEGDDPPDPSTAAGMPQPWPVVDKHSTYQHPPSYGGSPQPGPSYGPPQRGPRRAGGSRWLVAALVAVVLLALVLWLLLG